MTPQSDSKFCCKTLYRSLNVDSGRAPALVFTLTDMPNCSRAMRMTSLVVSMLLTASVLAWTSREGKRQETVHTLVAIRDCHQEKRSFLHRRSCRYPWRKSSAGRSWGHPSPSPRLFDCEVERMKGKDKLSLRLDVSGYTQSS